MKYTGANPKRHDKTILASWLRREEATTAGEGRLRGFGVLPDRGEPSRHTSHRAAHRQDSRPATRQRAEETPPAAAHRDRPDRDRDRNRDERPPGDWTPRTGGQATDSRWSKRDHTTRGTWQATEERASASRSHPYHAQSSTAAGSGDRRPRQEGWEGQRRPARQWERDDPRGDADRYPWRQPGQHTEAGWWQGDRRSQTSHERPPLDNPSQQAAGWGSYWDSSRAAHHAPTAGSLPTPPPVPAYEVVAVGAEATSSVFVMCLQKYDRNWAFFWKTWRDTRPPPPGNGRRTYDPKLVPQEARTFIDTFGLGRVFQDWERRTRHGSRTDEQRGEQRGIRRVREERRWEEHEPRQGRPRRSD